MTLIRLLFEGTFQVLAAGLILGAGVPAVYSLGVRAWTWGARDVDTIVQHRPHLIAKIAAAVCFGIVLAAIAFGIFIIVAGGFGLEVIGQWPFIVAK